MSFALALCGEHTHLCCLCFVNLFFLWGVAQHEPITTAVAITNYSAHDPSLAEVMGPHPLFHRINTRADNSGKPHQISFVGSGQRGSVSHFWVIDLLPPGKLMVVSGVDHCEKHTRKQKKGGVSSHSSSSI